MPASDLSVTFLPHTPSTNRLAIDAIETGAPQGTVFAADCQSAGRGRRHADGSRRPWFSPPGKNLYLSVVVRPDLAVHESAAITIAVGCALVELLRKKTGVDLKLKWPNDLYVGDKKLGGILTEAVTSRRGLQGAALGIGLNINLTPDDFPDELRDIATSLAAHTGHRLDRLSLLTAVAEAVVDASDTFAERGLQAFSRTLEDHDWLRERRIEVDDDGDRRQGTAIGIGESGGLCVRFDDGTTGEIVSGEVSVV